MNREDNSSQPKDRKASETAFNPFEDTSAFFGSEAVDVERYFNECKDLVFDRNFPTPDCLKPAQISEFSHNGTLTGPEKDHVEACVHCRALLQMLVPNPEILAAFQKQVIALRGAQEREFRIGKSINHRADGFSSLKPFGRFAVAALLLCATLSVGRYITQFRHDTAHLEPTGKPPVPPRVSSESQVVGLKPHEDANPFPRKVWAKKRPDSINNRLDELEAVKAKNEKEVQDVDSRAQAGIRQAQSAVDAANQTATAANNQAQQAGNNVQSPANHADDVSGTVNGLDSYMSVTETEVTFRPDRPILSSDAKKQLDDLATTVNGLHGYILEVEGHSPLAGIAGIQDSERLAEVVKLYLATEHEIPVYRMHSVALGNAMSAPAQYRSDLPTRVDSSTVNIRLMENQLSYRRPDGTQVKPKDEKKP
jgi:outer membrane protein OmpA-like peptidoglycan-associated protein